MSKPDIDTQFVGSVKSRWRAVPQGGRTTVSVVFKAIITLGVFGGLLFLPYVDNGEAGKTSLWNSVVGIFSDLSLGVFLTFICIASAIKMVGVLSSIWRWKLLLQGQGIRFNFHHVFGAFLIGRFIGTFLPSTVGLDGYKIYDASRFSDSLVKPVAATAIEKALGFSGIFLSFLVALPFGYPVLESVMGEATITVVTASVMLSAGVIMALALTLLKPGLVEAIFMRLRFGNERLLGLFRKVSDAAVAYRGKGRLLGMAFLLSFMVHFTTAAMYYFTALSIEATGAHFWQVTLASSIQILATVLTPLTIGGEGIREAAQALLLSNQIGTAAAVVSATLGFLAAEVPTMLVGVVYLWARGDDYRPDNMRVDDTREPPEESELMLYPKCRPAL